MNPVHACQNHACDYCFICVTLGICCSTVNRDTAASMLQSMGYDIKHPVAQGRLTPTVTDTLRRSLTNNLSPAVSHQLMRIAEIGAAQIGQPIDVVVRPAPQRGAVELVPAPRRPPLPRTLPIPYRDPCTTHRLTLPVANLRKDH